MPATMMLREPVRRRPAAGAEASPTGGRGDACTRLRFQTVLLFVPDPAAMIHPLRIGVLVEGRYLSQAQPAGMMAALRTRGHEVVAIVVDEAAEQIGVDTWLEGLDLIVARGRAWHLLCLLGWAEARRARTVNRHASIAAVCNKAE